MLAVASCSTSHKAFYAATSIQRDTTTAITHDTAHSAVLRTDGVSRIVADSTRHTDVRQSDATNEETINEQITEQSDSLGNRTVKTSRTITRRSTASATTATDTYQSHIEHEIAAMYERIDSMATIHSIMYQGHAEYNDSIRQEQQRDTTASGLSWWDLVKSYIAMAVIGFFIALVIYCANKIKS